MTWRSIKDDPPPKVRGFHKKRQPVRVVRLLAVGSRGKKAAGRYRLAYVIACRDTVREFLAYWQPSWASRRK